MKVVGQLPSLTVAQSTRARTVYQRRAKVKAQIASLKAELHTLPTMHELAAEHDVSLATILNAVHGRHVKHHLVEARERLASTGVQPQC